MARQLARLASDLLVVAVARRAEHLLHFLVAEPLDEAGLDQRGVSATLDDLAQDPVQVLVRLVAARQSVDGVLDADRTEPL